VGEGPSSAEGNGAYFLSQVEENRDSDASAGEKRSHTKEDESGDDTPMLSHKRQKREESLRVLDSRCTENNEKLSSLHDDVTEVKDRMRLLERMQHAVDQGGKKEIAKGKPKLMGYVPYYHNMMATVKETGEEITILASYNRRTPSSISIDAPAKEETWVTFKRQEASVDMPLADLTINPACTVGETVLVSYDSRDGLGMPRLPHAALIGKVKAAGHRPNTWVVDVRYTTEYHNENMPKGGAKEVKKSFTYPGYYVAPLSDEDMETMHVNKLAVPLTKEQTNIWLQSLIECMQMLSANMYNFNLDSLEYFGCLTIVDSFNYVKEWAPYTNVPYSEPKTKAGPPKRIFMKDYRCIYDVVKHQEWRDPLRQVRTVESALRAAFSVDHPCVAGLSRETETTTGLLEVTHKIYVSNQDRLVHSAMKSYKISEAAEGSVVEGLSAAYQTITMDIRRLIHKQIPGLTAFIRDKLCSTKTEDDGIRMSIEDALYGNLRKYDMCCHVGPLSPVRFSPEKKLNLSRYPLSGPLGDNENEHRRNRSTPVCRGRAGEEMYPL
jgi:hypothetical protein